MIPTPLMIDGEEYASLVILKVHGRKILAMISREELMKSFRTINAKALAESILDNKEVPRENGGLRALEAAIKRGVARL